MRLASASILQDSSDSPERIFTGRMKREHTEAASGGAFASAGYPLTYQRAAMPRAMRSASAMHVSMGFTAGLPGKIPVSVM